MSTSTRADSAEPDDNRDLTRRERAQRWNSLAPGLREIADLSADMKTSKEVASQLSISYRTVDNQLRIIYQKLEIDGTVARPKMRLREIREDARRLASQPSFVNDIPLLGSLVGRANEAEQFRAALDDPECRIVVLWGMHGVGKSWFTRSRLAAWLNSPAGALASCSVIDCEPDEDLDVLAELGLAVGLNDEAVAERGDLNSAILREFAERQYVIIIESAEQMLNPSGNAPSRHRAFRLRDTELEQLLIEMGAGAGSAKLIITTTHDIDCLSSSESGRVRYIGQKGRTFGGLAGADADLLLDRYPLDLDPDERSSLIARYEGHPAALSWAGQLLADERATFDELMKGSGVSLAARIESLLGRVYVAMTADQIHVLRQLAVLRRPAGDDLLSQLFSLSPPPDGSSWKVVASQLAEKSLVQSIASGGVSQFYLHILVRALVLQRAESLVTENECAALAYEQEMNRLWERDEEQAEAVGLESVRHYAAMSDRDAVRRLDAVLTPQLANSGRKYARLGRYEDVLETLNEQIEILGAAARTPGDHKAQRRLGRACFHRARARMKTGAGDREAMEDLEVAVRYSGFPAAFNDYLDLLERRGAELVGPDLPAKLEVLRDSLRALGPTSPLMSETLLARTGLLWFRTAPTEQGRIDARTLLESLFASPELWAPPSYYRSWASAALVLGDHDNAPAHRTQHYESAHQALVSGMTHHPRDLSLVIAWCGLQRRAADAEESAAARKLIDDARKKLQHATRAASVDEGKRRAVDGEALQLEIAAAALDPDQPRKRKTLKRLAKRAATIQPGSGPSAAMAVTICDQLFALVDSEQVPADRIELLDMCQQLLDPLVDASTQDWRVYYRYVRAIARRGDLEGRVPEAMISAGLEAIRKAGPSASSPRLLRAKAELYRRQLDRIGWRGDQASRQRAFQSADRAIGAALKSDPSDIFNLLERALLYRSAARSAVKNDDAEKYSKLAARTFDDIIERADPPSAAYLEYALFCRGSWQYRRGVEMYRRYSELEARRVRVWRSIHIFVELVIGLLREAPGDEIIGAALEEAEKEGQQAVAGGFATLRLLAGLARIMHELGGSSESADLFVRAFPSAEAYLTGISERRADFAALQAEQRDAWSLAFESGLGDPWLANSLGTFLKECRGDAAGALSAYDVGLSLARGVDEVAEAVLYTNRGLVLIESSDPSDLLAAHHDLVRARELSRGRYTFARTALDQLSARPEFQDAVLKSEREAVGRRTE